MNDLISRQAAIEVIKNVFLEVLKSLEMDANREDECFRYMGEVDVILACNKKTRSALRDLPPVQDNADEWCVDCKEYDQEKKCCPRINKVIRNSLNEIRPRGKWVPIERQLFGHSVIWDYCCSRCKEKAYKDEDGNHFLTNFCPDCGADMRG